MDETLRRCEFAPDNGGLKEKNTLVSNCLRNKASIYIILTQYVHHRCFSIVVRAFICNRDWFSALFGCGFGWWRTTSLASTLFVWHSAHKIANLLRCFRYRWRNSTMYSLWIFIESWVYMWMFYNIQHQNSQLLTYIPGIVAISGHWPHSSCLSMPTSLSIAALHLCRRLGKVIPSEARNDNNVKAHTRPCTGN